MLKRTITDGAYACNKAAPMDGCRAGKEDNSITPFDIGRVFL
jgi:hypothetical protein